LEVLPLRQPVDKKKKDQRIALEKSHTVYQRSKVGLSISLMNDLDCYTSDRALRILGCGALLLVKSFSMMSVLGLIDGVNCLAWGTAEEAVEKAKLALSPDADPIRKTGAELAREHHGWGTRMEEMMAYVNAVRSAR